MITIRNQNIIMLCAQVQWELTEATYRRLADESLYSTDDTEKGGKDSRKR